MWKVVRVSLGGVLLLLVAFRPARAGSVVEGVVVIPAQPPPPVPGWRYPSRVVGEVGDPEPPAAVVYLDAPSPPGVDAAPLEMGQLRYQFAPGLLAVRVGSVVRFPNRDDEYHSVFSYSKTKRFDLGRYHRDETAAEIRFDQPGLVRLYCEIHDHMRGTILVLDTPYFVKTDAEGRYRLEGVPAGHHRMKAWRPPDELVERTLDVPDGGTVRVDFP
jgi:plastocyanin